MSEWRKVRDFPYEVSDDGRVRRSESGRVLRAHTDRDGYAVVILCRDGIRHTRKIHRLVCEAWHGPSLRAEVRHLDGDPANNRPDNLRWGTTAENAEDRARHGRTARGAKHPRARLTEAQVAQIRADHARAQQGRQRVPRGWRTAVAAQHGISVHAVHTIVAGRGYAE